MKQYISRLKKGIKPQISVLWWALRVITLFIFVANFFSDNFTLTGQLHIALCFAASFLWEFSLAMPEKSLFRFMPSSIHTFLNIGFAVSAVCGIYLNCYYDLFLFDPLLQAYFGFISVLYGYEIGYAMVKRDRFEATKAMVFFVAFGVSFMCFNAWELGEFFGDQLVGVTTGKVGNSQFWSVAVSQGTAREESLIPSIVPERLPLMDIMGDIIVHSISSIAALIFINLCPYRLRGKYKYDIEYGNNCVEVK